jgi:hypothetical protein
MLLSFMSYVVCRCSSYILTLGIQLFFIFMHKNRVHLIAEFHQLCCRQFALIIGSLHSILIQIRLVRDLERAGDKAPLSSSELRLKLQKLQGELIDLVDIIDVMKEVTNNYLNNHQ